MQAFGSVRVFGQLRWQFLVLLAAFVMSACGEENVAPNGTVAIEVSKYAVVLPPTSDTALTATISGTELNEPITWTSSAPGVATVRDDGPFGVITGVSEGTATIYAVRKSNSKVKSLPVTVTVVRIPALKAFTVDTAVQEFLTGDSRTFALSPLRAETRTAVTYAFTSNNPSVATVNPTTGVVTAVAPGSATIGVTATGTGTGLTTNMLSASAQVLVGALLPRFRRITAGRWHTCAIRQSGDTFCWGWNGAGQLGDGTFADRTTPIRVSGTQIFSEISAGFQHTCGLTAAGAVYCWGGNAQGRLGDGTTTNRLIPTAVSSAVVFSAVEAGGSHTCAISVASAAYCWGENRSAQLGTGNFTESLVPIPIQLPGVSIKTISAGLLSACATSATNVGYCWGNLSSSGPVPTVLESGVSIAQYALGQFSKCLLSTSGRLYCPLGNGDYRLGGMPNAGPPFPYVLGVVLKAIVSGDAHGCGINLQNDAYCWGSNVDGRMGIGTSGSTVVNTLRLVAGGLKFVELAAGEAHTCGITTSDQVYCWGSNSNGQIGSVGPQALTPKLVTFSQ